LTFWKPFSGNGSTDWTIALHQMESPLNKVDNGPLG
jgi:hypothetical protein